MKTLVIVVALLTACMGTQALSQQSPELQSRYMRACMADGDSEGYCRCEFDLVIGNASAEDIETGLLLIEAGEANDQQALTAIAEQRGPEEMQRIIALFQRIDKDAEARCRPANPRPAPR